MTRWDEVLEQVGRGGTFRPVFIGWDRPTPFGFYKIKEREGWGRRIDWVRARLGWGRRMGPCSIVVKPRF